MFGKSDQPKQPKKKADYEERRQYERIKKSFLLSYFDPQHPDEKFEITQLKNISLGGMCFVTTCGFKPGTRLGIELKTPYIAGSVYLEGDVLQSHEKMKHTIYETRLQFQRLETEAIVTLEKLMEFFKNDNEPYHE